MPRRSWASWWRITAGGGSARRIESVQIARPTLDDVFLHHTGRGLRE